MVHHNLTLRPYRPEDGDTVAGWFRNERTMRLWSANRYDHFPITGDNINAHYAEYADNPDFQSFMAWDGDVPVGHFALLRRVAGEVRLLYVVVDDSCRGQGYGQRMMKCCAEYAFEQFSAENLTLCVFAQNEIARRCYEKSGFREIPESKIVTLMNEDWLCLDMALPREEYKHHNG